MRTVYICIYICTYCSSNKFHTFSSYRSKLFLFRVVSLACEFHSVPIWAQWNISQTWTMLEIMGANNFTPANHYRFGLVDLQVIQLFLTELLHHSHAVITTILKSNCKPQTVLRRVYIKYMMFYHNIWYMYHKSDIHFLASFNYISCMNAHWKWQHVENPIPWAFRNSAARRQFSAARAAWGSDMWIQKWSAI